MRLIPFALLAALASLSCAQEPEHDPQPPEPAAREGTAVDTLPNDTLPPPVMPMPESPDRPR